MIKLPVGIVRNDYRMEDHRLFLCKNCGMVLGVVSRDANRRYHLNVLRHGADVKTMPKLGDVKKINYAVRNLDYGTVVCSLCGNERTYHYSEDALNALIDRVTHRPTDVV